MEPDCQLEAFGIDRTRRPDARILWTGMKRISRIAPALALLVATVATTTLHADTLDRVAPRVVASGAEGGPTVHVVNNHRRQVRVYVVDSHNR